MQAEVRAKTGTATGPAMWRNSGRDHRSTPHRTPDLTVISGAPRPGAPLAAEPGRPLIIRVGKHLRGVFDRLIASSSLVSNDPVLDVRDFPWTQHLRDNWQAIRDEMLDAAMGDKSPSLSSISPDHRAIAPVNKWRSFFLWGYGYRID